MVKKIYAHTSSAERIAEVEKQYPGVMRLPRVMTLTGVSRATIYRWMSLGLFPASIKLYTSVTAWRTADIVLWIEERAAQTQEEEVA